METKIRTDESPVLVFLSPPHELATTETVCRGFKLLRNGEYGAPPVMSWNPNALVDDSIVVSGSQGGNYVSLVHMQYGGTVRNSYLENTDQSPMFYMEAAGSELLVEDCEILGVFADGLYFGSQTRAVFRNNSITADTHINLLEGADTDFIAEFVNNIFFDEDILYDASGVVPDSLSVRYNCYWDVNMPWESSEFFENDPTNFEADPLFCGAVLTPQWHWLDQASPCFGAGENGEDVGARIGICGVTGVLDTLETSWPPSSDLLHIWPNPSSDGIWAAYSGMAGSDVEAWVLDTTGRRVAVTSSRIVADGVRFVWDGRSDSGGTVPAGSYFLQLRSNQGPSASRRFTIVR